MECLIPGRFATRGPLAILILVGLLQTGASVLLIRNVGHLLTVSPETVSVWTLAIPLMAVAILAACRLAEMWQAERLAQRIIHAQRSMLARHLLKLPPRSPKSSRSEVLLRFMGEMSALRSWHMRAVPVLLIGIPVVVGGLVALGFRDPRLSLAVVLPVIASIILQITLSSRHFKTAEHTRRTRTRLARNVSRHFEALPALNAFGRTAKAEREIEKHSASFSEAMIGRAWDAGLLRASAEFGANGTIISVLAIWFLAPGYDPSALAGALVFVALLSPKLRALGRVPEQFNLARIASRRIEAFMTEAPLDAREDSAGIARRAGRLKLRDVGIAGLFEGFHATAEPGARVLLEGPNGAGKSRLLGLIAGLEDPDTGRIVLDGRDTGLRRRASLCKLVAMAGSGMPLAAGRVEDNLNYGDRVSEGERDRILTLCRWQQLEASLPQGRRTQIETGAPNLSTGQRARIGLIRALLRRPRILLLDEIDSTLDAEGREILEEIIAWFDGTVMIASHDTRWRQVVDTVWTLPTQNSKLFGREVQADV